MQRLCAYGRQLLGWLGMNLAVLIAAAALIFTGWQIRAASRAYQAATVGQIAARTDELQWRILNTPDLRELLTGTPEPTPLQQQQVACALIINHFATIYDLHKLGGIPAGPWSAFKSDMKETLSAPIFQKRWQQLKSFHRPDFVDFVTNELGVPEDPRKPQRE